MAVEHSAAVVRERVVPVHEREVHHLEERGRHLEALGLAKTVHHHETPLRLQVILPAQEHVHHRLQVNDRLRVLLDAHGVAARRHALELLGVVAQAANRALEEHPHRGLALDQAEAAHSALLERAVALQHAALLFRPAGGLVRD